MNKTFRHVVSLLVVLACLPGLDQVALAQVPAQTTQDEQPVLQVNINEADAETIADILTGIGASRARAIVEYREQNGRFATLEELTRVTGVGEATVMNNRERIKFE